MDAEQLAVSGVGKSSWTKYPRKQVAVKKDRTDFRFHEPATEFGQFRAALPSAVATGPVEAERVAGCEPSLFLVGRVRPLGFKKLTRNHEFVTNQSLYQQKCESTKRADRSRGSL